MPKPPSAAKPDLASAMWPALSQAAKMKEAEQAKAQAEQKLRRQSLLDNLQSTIDAVRKEKER